MDSHLTFDTLDAIDTFDDSANLDVISPHPEPLLHLLSWAVGPPADVIGFCTLRNGARVKVRPIHSDDLQRLRAFHLRLSPQTIFLRFAHLLKGFPEDLAASLVCVDGDQRMAFVATDDVEDSTHEEIIAVARYNHIRPQVAEMAAVVGDAWQGHGLGPIMLYRLAIYARSRGYTTFIAPMSRWNRHAIHALMQCGLAYTLKQLDEDTLLVSLDITQLDHPGEQAGHGSA